MSRSTDARSPSSRGSASRLDRRRHAHRRGARRAPVDRLLRRSRARPTRTRRCGCWLSSCASAPRETSLPLLDDRGCRRPAHPGARALRAGSAEFLLRHPRQLAALGDPLDAPADAEDYRSAADRSRSPELAGEEAAWNALRVATGAICCAWPPGTSRSPTRSARSTWSPRALADLAGAALDASLRWPRRATSLFRAGRGRGDPARDHRHGQGGRPRTQLPQRRRRDLRRRARGEPSRTTMRARRRDRDPLAMETMRGIHELAIEPPLWEVDANLRPEGKDGALVRTLESHLAYYERWAKSWEFQALLKARPLAGDLELGERYVAASRRWSGRARRARASSSRCSGCASGSPRNIPADEVDVQLKLGPGGLRDVEFTIQLLQLVHGQADPAVRQRGDARRPRRARRPGLHRPRRGGRVRRATTASCGCSSTGCSCPGCAARTSCRATSDALRVLARATGVAADADELIEHWQRTKREVRTLHERLFYRPLLSAVAALPDDGLRAHERAGGGPPRGDRLPRPARAPCATSRRSPGASRGARPSSATCCRSCSSGSPTAPTPTTGCWRSAGSPTTWARRTGSCGCCATRRARPSRLTQRAVGLAVRRRRCSSASPRPRPGSRTTTSCAPRSPAMLLEEAAATVARHDDDPDAAALALRTARRREVLRLALGRHPRAHHGRGARPRPSATSRPRC